MPVRLDGLFAWLPRDYCKRDLCVTPMPIDQSNTSDQDKLRFVCCDCLVTNVLRLFVCVMVDFWLLSDLAASMLPLNKD